jgi:hypothetical protein
MAETIFQSNLTEDSQPSATILTPDKIGDPNFLVNINETLTPDSTLLILETALASFERITVETEPLPGCPAIRDFPLPVFGADPVLIPLPPIAPELDPLPPLADLTAPLFTGTPFSAQLFDGVAPVTPDFPISPNAPALNTIIPFALDGTPVLGGSDPDIVFPLAPADFAGVIPLSPVLAEPLIPPTPDDTLPAAPLLADVTLPTAPTIFIPSFLATLSDGPIAPTDTFSYNEVPYTDDLLDDLTDKLEFFLGANTTGLSALIWQQIWDRATEREDFLAIKARDEGSMEFAARGFSLPPGAQVARDQEILQGNQDIASSLSREQAIEEARLEVENVRFAITSTIELQIALIRNHSEINARALEVARLTVELPITLFRAEVDAHNVEVQAFRAQVDVFTALLQAEITKIEIFKAEIDAQRLITEINSAQIANYRAQIDAVIATFDLFRAQLEAARFTLDQNRLRIEEFQSLVAAFEAEARVQVATAQIFESKINAERLKVDVRRTEVDAFAAQVQSFAAVNNAKQASKQQEIDVERFKIENFQAEVQAVTAQIAAKTAELTADVDVFNSFIAKFGSQTDAESRRVTADTAVFSGEIEAFSATSRRDTDLASASASRSQAVATLFGAEVQAFGAEALAESARFEAEVGKYGTDVTGYSARITRDLGEARVCVDQLVAQLSLLQEKIIAEARIAGQIAAATISQQSFSTVFSNTNSASTSHSVSLNSTGGGQEFRNYSFACDCP